MCFFALVTQLCKSQFYENTIGGIIQDDANSISIINENVLFLSGYGGTLSGPKKFDGFGCIINTTIDSILFRYFEDTAQYNSNFKGMAYNNKCYSAGFTSTSCCDTAYDLDGTLYKMDMQGNYTHVQFGGNYYDQPIDVTAIGKYLYVAGWTQSNTIEPYSANALDGYLVKLDTNLNVIWEKHYGSMQPDQFVLIEKSIDNQSFYCAGVTNNTTVNNGIGDAYLVKIDTSGNIIWQKQYNVLNNYNEDIQSLTICENGDLLLGTRAAKVNDDVIIPYIIRVDSAGNLIYKKTMYDVTQSEFTAKNKRWYSANIESIDEIPNGDIIFCGSWFDQDSTTNYGFVCRYTANGDSIWRRDFVQAYYDIELKDLVIDTDTIFACGSFFNPYTAYGGKDAYIVKMDINGCFLDSCLISSVAIAKPKQEAQTLLYPNPANEIINLKITQPNEVINISIINSLGQIVTSTQVIKELNTFNTQDLCNGIYTLQVRRKEGIENLKFVINH